MFLMHFATDTLLHLQILLVKVLGVQADFFGTKWNKYKLDRVA